MRYSLTFAPRALADLERIKKSGDQARIKENTYSRRLSGKDRVVYSVYESVVQVNILQMLGHYNDK